MFATLVGFVAYGVWRGRGAAALQDYVLAGRSLRAPAVLLGVMATQASAVTFLATPGQGFADGLRFVQFYFGLPLAMVVVCLIAIPAFRSAGVLTAYEYLERRFDGKTRSLAAALFLVQRGLSAGITIYAPALVLSVLLGWDIRWMCLLIGTLAVIYTTTGGGKALAAAHVLQFLIIMTAMCAAFILLVHALPEGVGVRDAAFAAGRLDRMHALNLKFDPDDRYNLWSGLMGGFFLQLSYFGADQSQVGRYLSGRSVDAARRGLLWNGLFKIPMQFGILFLGVMLFAYYLFAPGPLSFNPVAAAKVEASAHAGEWHALERQYAGAIEHRAAAARDFIAARRTHDAALVEPAGEALRSAQGVTDSLRKQANGLIRAVDPAAPPTDTNYVFLGFVLHHLPIGLIGMILAAIFAAAMNSSSSELNALASTTVVDIANRVSPGRSEGGSVQVSRLATLAWALFAVGFAEFAAGLGSLVEAVNIVGSLFYGTMLGIFLSGFLIRRATGTGVVVGAVIAESVVIACFKLTPISFLWYNLIGCLIVMLVAALIGSVPKAEVSRP